MKKEQDLKELSESIVKVYDETFFEIMYTKAEVKEYISKYSSSHVPTPKLYLDDKVISQPGKMKVSYRCSCGRIETILLVRFLTKQTPLRCIHCGETEEKRKWHSECIRMNHLGIEYEHRMDSYKRTYNFDAETEEFKKEYFQHNLTLDEFEKIKKYIYSVKGMIVEGKNFELLLHENGANHKKYRQMILFENKKVPFKDIKLRCPLCGEIFSISRLIKERVIKNNFDCRACYLSNKIFAIKKYSENLTYQSNSELKFIKQCEKHNIKITNGPVIKYVFGDKNREYRTDFELPDLSLIIEIKDTHIWHKKQVESGKWEAKENAAIEYCNKNNKVYKLLFTKDIDDFFKYLERDSLDYDESHRS